MNIPLPSPISQFYSKNDRVVYLSHNELTMILIFKYWKYMVTFVCDIFKGWYSYMLCVLIFKPILLCLFKYEKNTLTLTTKILWTGQTLLPWRSRELNNGCVFVWRWHRCWWHRQRRHFAKLNRSLRLINQINQLWC